MDFTGEHIWNDVVKTRPIAYEAHMKPREIQRHAFLHNGDNISLKVEVREKRQGSWYARIGNSYFGKHGWQEGELADEPRGIRLSYWRSQEHVFYALRKGDEYIRNRIIEDEGQRT